MSFQQAAEVNKEVGCSFLRLNRSSCVSISSNVMVYNHLGNCSFYSPLFLNVFPVPGIPKADTPDVVSQAPSSVQGHAHDFCSPCCSSVSWVEREHLGHNTDCNRVYLRQTHFDTGRVPRPLLDVSLFSVPLTGWTLAVKQAGEKDGGKQVSRWG